MLTWSGKAKRDSVDWSEGVDVGNVSSPTADYEIPRSRSLCFRREKRVNADIMSEQLSLGANIAIIRLRAVAGTSIFQSTSKNR